MTPTAPMRSVLYVNPQEQCYELFPALHDAGWHPHPITAPDGTQVLPPPADCAVGVLRLSQPTDPSRLAALEHLIADDQREWIAVLPAALTAEPGVQRLIADRCFDYLSLPVDATRIASTLGHAYGMATLKRGHGERADGTAGWTRERVVGSSGAAVALRRAIAKLARSRDPVLITGERGSGKALAARAIHEESGRADGPFITLNCTAISPEFHRFELLGREHAAFAGTSRPYIGRIEAAAGGTLFLDEMGELPLELQADLLDFLQHGRIRRIGGIQTLRLDVRVIAASPAPLSEAVAAGRFRSDLMSMLDVLHLHVPSLSERRGDIEALARHFFREFRPGGRRGPRAFAPEAMAALHRHDWPGNVGELANRIRRAVVMSEERFVSSADLGLDLVETADSPLTLEGARDEAERRILIDALDRHRGNVTRAARELDVSRVTLYRLLDKHSIRGERQPAAADCAV